MADLGIVEVFEDSMMIAARGGTRAAMRWLLCLGLFLIGCRTIPPHSELEQLPIWDGEDALPALNTEEYDVISVILKEDFLSRSPGKKLIVQSVIWPQQRMLQDPTPPEESVEADYEKKRHLGGRVEQRFSVGLVHLISSQERTAYWKHQECSQGWKVFWRDHPMHIGVIDLERVGISADHKTAMVRIKWLGGCECGETSLYWLEHSTGSWNVVSKRLEFVN